MSSTGGSLYKRSKRWSVAQLVRGAAAVLSVLPRAWALFVGRWLGRGAGVLPSLRHRAVSQIEAALAVSSKEAENISRRMFEHIGMTAVELALLPRLLPRLPDYVRFESVDRQILESALDEGRGVVFVSGHVGSWELLAQRIVLEGFPSATVVRAATNPYLEAWLSRRRSMAGLGLIPRRASGAVRDMLRALKQGGLLGVLIDQDTRVPSVHVPFFGRPAATPIMAARLALRYRAPVVLGTIERRTEGGHQIRLERIPIPEGADRTERARLLTASLSTRLEAVIRRHPEQWVWFHERWRTPPPAG